MFYSSFYLLIYQKFFHGNNLATTKKCNENICTTNPRASTIVASGASQTGNDEG